MTKLKCMSAVLILAVVGCASPRKMYPGDVRSDDEVAIIDNYSETDFDWIYWRFGDSLETFVLKIDGKEHDGTSKAAVLPGSHSVEAALIWTRQDFEDIRFRDPEPLVFDAKAGRTYCLKAGILETGEGQMTTGFWIEDLESGETVAGMR